MNNQIEMFPEGKSPLKTIREASQWATNFLKRDVAESNISYLVQYGRINKYGSNGATLIDINELKEYYEINNQEIQWKKTAGDDLNWKLSFSEYRESERTKHVHRLHPYKGKFIPQLVEYFLDDHTDKFKKEVFFNKGDIVLDPFSGSGTTLVQANELGIHAIGVDVSKFNCLIGNSKVNSHDLVIIKQTLTYLTDKLIEFQKSQINVQFEEALLSELYHFNNKFFPSPEFRRDVRNKRINELGYGREKEKIFLEKYYQLLNQFNLSLEQDKNDSFLDIWFVKPVREEIDYMSYLINDIQDDDIKKVVSIILSRTVRSCRATTHADLGTLIKPVYKTYYCKKHGKICKPIYSILNWWKRYASDTIQRFYEFEKIRTNTFQTCLSGDSRRIDIIDQLEGRNNNLINLVKKQKIKGIFSSPPYVGLIDYHEQHAYAYDIFGYQRNDEMEIGPLFKGQGKEARDSYVVGISDVLNNFKKFLVDDYNIFLVANDKYDLYPNIANKAGMAIVNRYKRPVLNRVEKDRSNSYSEIIFHLRAK